MTDETDQRIAGVIICIASTAIWVFFCSLTVFSGYTRDWALTYVKEAGGQDFTLFGGGVLLCGFLTVGAAIACSYGLFKLITGR